VAGPDPALRAIGAASVLALALGALHGFSVLVPALEAATGAGRAAVGAIYGGATFALMLGVLASPALIARLPQRRLILLAGGGAAAGPLVALWGGYGAALGGLGVLFGFCNGVGYAAALRIAAGQGATAARAGAGIGIATGCYCAGASVFAFAAEPLPEGLAPRLWLLAAICAAGAVAAAALLPAAGRGADVPRAATVRVDLTHAERQAGWRLWALYLAGMLAGLMVFGHAGPIMAAAGGAAALGAAAVSAGSLAGSLGAGALAARAGPWAGIAAALGTLAAGALLAAAATGAAGTFGALLLAGTGYGALITVVPVGVERLARPAVAPRLFARVFTAWGIGGLAGPVAGGALQALSQGYALPLGVAGVLAAIAAGLALPRRARS
jgi:OFA family oxalate/formate antiporter-like MFS transporter